MKAGIGSKLWVITAAALGIGIFAACGTVLAAEAGDSGGELKDLLYRFINFGLLVIVLVVAVKKAPVKDFFEARKKRKERRNQTENTRPFFSSSFLK